jgi:Ner family transcriptional regulator
MDRSDILAAIRGRGWSLAQLAANAQVPPQYLSHALRAPNPQGEKVILDFLKKPGHEVWPDRYSKDGTRIVRRGGAPQRGFLNRSGEAA